MLIITPLVFMIKRKEEEKKEKKKRGKIDT
jgi:hypothetical protein